MALTIPKYLHPYNFKDFLIAGSGLFIDYSPELKKEIIQILKKEYNVYFFESGRSALNLVLQELKLPQGSEVAIPVNICEVVVETILSNNLKPLLIDVTNNLTICPKDLQKKITNKTKVILPVHTFGNLYDVEEIQKIAKKNQCIVIEDCAQTLTSKYKERNVGTFGDYAFFSLDITKHISSFGGGVLITKKLLQINAKQDRGIKKLFEFALFKFLTNQIIYTILTKKITSKIKALSYYPPRNKKLSKIGIALAYSQIKKINQIDSLKEENVKKIVQMTKDNFQIYSENIDKHPTHTVLPIRALKKTKIENYLKKRIDLPQPVPLLTHITKYQNYWNKCPNAEKIQNQLLLLPIHTKISKNTEKILENIKNIN